MKMKMKKLKEFYAMSMLRNVKVRNIVASNCGRIGCKHDAYFYIQGQSAGMNACEMHLADHIATLMVQDAEIFGSQKLEDVA
jgi:hypothetical protein